MPAAPGSSSTNESMISCRSFSIELTRELWLAQAEGPRVAGWPVWFPFTRLSDSAERKGKEASGFLFFGFREPHTCTSKKIPPNVILGQWGQKRCVLAPALSATDLFCNLSQTLVPQGPLL